MPRSLTVLLLLERTGFRDALPSHLNTRIDLHFQAFNRKTVGLPQDLIVGELAMILVYFALSISHQQLHRVDKTLLRLPVVRGPRRSLVRFQQSLVVTVDRWWARQRYLLEIKDALDFSDLFVTARRHIILNLINRECHRQQRRSLPQSECACGQSTTRSSSD